MGVRSFGSLNICGEGQCIDSGGPDKIQGAEFGNETRSGALASGAPEDGVLRRLVFFVASGADGISVALWPRQDLIGDWQG